MRSNDTMTVADLRKAIEDLPEDTRVYFYTSTTNEETPGFSPINTLESACRGVVVLSNSGFWPEVYKNSELAGQIAIPNFDDR